MEQNDFSQLSLRQTFEAKLCIAHDIFWRLDFSDNLQVLDEYSQGAPEWVAMPSDFFSWMGY